MHIDEVFLYILLRLMYNLLYFLIKCLKMRSVFNLLTNHARPVMEVRVVVNDVYYLFRVLVSLLI